MFTKKWRQLCDGLRRKIDVLQTKIDKDINQHPLKALIFCTVSIAVIVTLLLLTSCALLDTKRYNIVDSDARSVAQYNLKTLERFNTNHANFLYVDEDGKTSVRNILMYINDLNEDVERSRICYSSLIDYNKQIVEAFSKR